MKNVKEAVTCESLVKRYTKSLMSVCFDTRVEEEEEKMVYCSKCGTLNSDDANVCVKCGAALYAGKEEVGDYWKNMRYREEYYGRARRGRSIAVLMIGVIIISLGLIFLIEQTYQINLHWWPIIIIIVGIWLLARAVLWRRR